MTQYALAKAAGMPQTHLKQIEDGVIEAPSVETVERLRVALKASPGVFYAPHGETLFVRDEPPHTPIPPPRPKSGERPAFKHQRGSR